MLSDFKGPANEPRLFRHVVGDTVKAAFVDDEGRVWLVLGGPDSRGRRGFGPAIVFAGGVCGPEGGPSWWVVDEDEVARVVAERRARVERTVAELRDVGDVEHGEER